MLKSDLFTFAAIDADVRLALFLDFDGTLVELAATPDATLPPPGLVDLLQNLSRALDGALAIVTGRPLADIDRLLAPALFRGAGVHGAEVRDATGGKVRAAAPPLTTSFVDSVRDLEVSLPGVLVEPKGAGIAVHYRHAVDKGAEVERRLRALLQKSGLELDLRPGKMLIEVLPNHVSKGGAVNAFMRQTPFFGRTPVVIGDDRGDIGAFEAAELLGGRGLRVAGEFFSPGHAQFSGTAEVRRWLEHLSGRISAAQGGDGA
jgi:trehalose 6-phosphate phosphatase